MSTGTAVRPTTVENIQVLQVGKFGVRVDEKTWFGVNEPLTPSHFVPNEGYKVSVVVSKTGKKYINEILGQEEKQEEKAQAASAPATSDPVKAAEAALAKAKSDAEAKAKAAAEAPKMASTSTASSKLDEKSIQIQRQGLYQAALQSPALAQWAVNIDEYLALVRKVTDAGIKYVAER